MSYIRFPQHNVQAISYLSCLFFNGILCATVTVLKPQQEDVCTSVKQNHTSLKWLAFFFTLCPLTNLKKQNCSAPLPHSNSYQILSKCDSDCPSHLTRVSWRIKKLRPRAKYTNHTLIIIQKKVTSAFLWVPYMWALYSFFLTNCHAHVEFATPVGKTCLDLSEPKGSSWIT